MYQMSQKGISNKDISDYLNKQQIKPKRTERYTTKLVWAILQKYTNNLPKRSSRSKAREFLTLQASDKLDVSKEKEMHKTGWANIELPLHLKKAREEQERLNQEKKDEDAAEKDLKFTTAEEYMNQQTDDSAD